MPAQVINRPNPPPVPSNLPDVVLELAAQLQLTTLEEPTNDALVKYRRAADYIAAAMIFLRDNVLLERGLTHNDIKPRLLGHWGTCPGLTLIYSHLNRVIIKNNVKMIYVVGPGHGAPSILACLWLEGSLEKFYPQYSRNKAGLHKLITEFSTPSGFPSHINAEVPGSIHEGGELGYALSVAFGAVMDNPDLVVACVVGDGECETGPTSTAWHGYKYIDPAESGAVIPIVHVNGFKISERTIFGCMDDRELAAIFAGYGYHPRFIENLDEIDSDMAVSMDWALAEIRRIQEAARSGSPIMKPRWPVLILRTPKVSKKFGVEYNDRAAYPNVKGWGGPKKVDGEFIEGSFHSHQVPLPKAKTSDGQLRGLQEWLLSYHPAELFREDGSVIESIANNIPQDDLMKLGQRSETYAAYVPLNITDWHKFSIEKGKQESCMHVTGELLGQALQDNPKTLRIFSPDELVSNKLDAVFRHTSRNFQWDEFANAQGGRVIEILSEHTCQGFLQGYTLTGRTGIFPSYESFLGIVHTMMVQYSKFNKMVSLLFGSFMESAHLSKGAETTWRLGLSSLNYIETSTWTRQEHNGFSHQNPSFIGAVLNLKASEARVYLPPDANCFLSTVAHCLRSKGYINLMVGSKQPQPVFLSPTEADSHCRAGASVWKFCSTDDGRDPDVVLVGIGSELTFEVIAAAALLRKKAPDLRVRVVNVTDLMILSQEGVHPHALDKADFDSLFTSDKPIHINYHGTSTEIKGLLFGRPNLDRVTIECYREEGSTTTPFDMLIRNCVSRYHVARSAVRGGGIHNQKVRLDQHTIITGLEWELRKAKEYIVSTGEGNP